MRKRSHESREKEEREKRERERERERERVVGDIPTFSPLYVQKSEEVTSERRNVLRGCRKRFFQSQLFVLGIVHDRFLSLASKSKRTQYKVSSFGVVEESLWSCLDE